MLQIFLKIDGKLTEAYGVSLVSLRKATVPFLISTCAQTAASIR